MCATVIPSQRVSLEYCLPNGKQESLHAEMCSLFLVFCCVELVGKVLVKILSSRVPRILETQIHACDLEQSLEFVSDTE